MRNIFLGINVRRKKLFMAISRILDDEVEAIPQETLPPPIEDIPPFSPRCGTTNLPSMP
jgi:hypothetical protein